MVNVGPPINSHYDERDPTITPDNRKLIFSRRRSIEPSSDYGLMHSLSEPDAINDVVEPIRSVNIEVYPNPTNSKVKIAFNGLAICRLRIVNSLGNIVREFDKNSLSGYGEVIWDGKDSSRKEVSSGVCLIHLQTTEINEFAKVSIVR